MKNLVCILFALVISAQVSAETDPYSQRKDLILEVVELTQEHICNPAFLETEQWEQFVFYINSEEVLQLSNDEFITAFNIAVKQLPFTHFYLKHNKKAKKKAVTAAAFELEEIDAKTVVLRIRRFAANARLMMNLVKEIEIKQYENLIIDVRDNRGGTLDAAVVLGRFLTNETIDAGTYINRSWFLAENRYPTAQDIATFPYLNSMDYKGFQEAAKNSAFRMVLPAHQNPVYKGKVIVLTNSKTASTCEPFVHVLRQKEVAQIVGEATAGAMLSGRSFKLSKEFSLFIPVQDYITAEGIRLDKLGVAPTIESSSNMALEVALTLIE